MDWVSADAISQLRTLLGDGPADKWEFKVNVFPTPDSVTTRFFVGQTRVVTDTMQVYHGGVLVTPDDVDYPKGSFDLTNAPSPSGGDLQASFYYQWFTDAQLATFLDDAAQMLSLYTAATSGFATLIAAGANTTAVSIEIGIRPSLLQFAAYNAYAQKAAESADSLSAGAPGGYSIDTGKRHPNWAGLAKLALEQGKAKLEMYVDNPLNSKRALVSFATFRLPRYQGP